MKLEHALAIYICLCERDKDLNLTADEIEIFDEAKINIERIGHLLIMDRLEHLRKCRECTNL